MTPYPFGPVGFDAPGGDISIIDLALPAVGDILTIRLNQLSGVKVAGSFRIFQSLEAAEAIAGSLASSSLAGTDPDDYSVVGVKAFTGGSYSEFQCRYGYANQDANITSRKRRLYLVMQPGGSGDKSFSLSLMIGEPTMITTGG